MSRITETFDRLRQENRIGMITYITVGYPAPDQTPELVQALVDGGSDIIELGVPFSDPLGDGPTIQRAGFAALTNGVTPAACIDAVRLIRARGVTVPLLLMGYANNVLSYGQEAFCRDLAEAGGDGFIIIDLPPEEAEDMRQTCNRMGLDLIFLLAPTSTETRIEQVARLASGFIYCVSLNGVTGARSQISTGLPAFLDRVRAHTSLPLAVGFGISTREHVEQLTGLADAVVVGSAVINTADRAPRGAEAAALREYVESLSQRRPEPTHR